VHSLVLHRPDALRLAGVRPGIRNDSRPETGSLAAGRGQLEPLEQPRRLPRRERAAPIADGAFAHERGHALRPRARPSTLIAAHAAEARLLEHAAEQPLVAARLLRLA